MPVHTRKIELPPYIANTPQRVTIEPVRFVLEPYPCLELGDDDRGRPVRVRIHQTLADDLQGADELGEVSVYQPTDGSAPTIIPFRQTGTPDDRLLSLLRISGGTNNGSRPQGGAAVYTATTSTMVDCHDRKRKYPHRTQLVSCPHCGTMLSRALAMPEHPDTGQIREWGAFPFAGVRVVAQGLSYPARGANDAYRVILAVLDIDVRFLVHRRGAKTKGEPETVGICWTGKEVILGNDDSFNPPPQMIDLTKGTII